MQKSKKNPNPYTNFLASTLHEIRTPIQTIIGTTELLGETQLDKEQVEYVRQIQFSADVLLSLSNDILDFTKLQSNNFKLESIPFDLTTLTEQVVDLVSIEAFNKGLEIVIDIDKSVPGNVTGDPTRVQQILLNLVKNAVKFTKHGYVHIALSNTPDNMILFEVIDSGIGVVPDARKNLFTEFYQAETSTARKYGGSGLGLSICRRLVTAMHGKIGIRENPYGGSIFWFALPLIAGIELPERKKILKTPPDTRILIVDDSMLATKSLRYKLETMGIQNLQTAQTGDEALLDLEYAALIGKPFTIAFIDMLMPIMDGWRLAADITANTLINNTKLYLVVPEGQMGAEAKMKILNWFNGYLYKPVKTKKLSELLNDAFSEPLELESVDDSPVQASGTLENGSESNLDSIHNNSIADPIRPAEGCKILVAEDHPVNRKIVVTFLKKFGAEVFEAEDGKIAEKIIESHSDIKYIFMDIQMPGKNGIETTVDLRAKGFTGIIIACTANSDTDDFENYKLIGMNDVLVKPFKSTKIKNILEKWNAVLQLPVAKDITVIKDNEMNPWDVADFLNTTDNDKTFAAQLLDDYCAQTEKLLAGAEVSLAAENLSELQQTGHTLKGSSSAISAEQLAFYGSCIQEASKNGNLAEIKKNYELFKVKFDEFKVIVQKWKDNI